METRQPPAPTSSTPATGTERYFDDPRAWRVGRAVAHMLGGILLVGSLEFPFLVASSAAFQSGGFTAMNLVEVLNLLAMVGTLVTGIVVVRRSDKMWLGVGLLVGSVMGGLFALILPYALAAALLSQM